METRGYHDEDLNYFEQELTRLQSSVAVPLMQRRLVHHSMDPIEELQEVYADVKEIESNLAKAVNIGNFIIAKNKSIIETNLEIQRDYDEMKIQR